MKAGSLLAFQAGTKSPSIDARFSRPAARVCGAAQLGAPCQEPRSAIHKKVSVDSPLLRQAMMPFIPLNCRHGLRLVS
jgi:hypothetical protein